MEDYGTYKDSELLVLFRANKKYRNDIFNVIFNKYSNKLATYCKYHVNDARQVEDIIQDTWFEFNKAARKGKPIESIKAYLTKIAYNKISIYRKHQKKDKAIFENVSGIELDRFNDIDNLPQRIENNDFMSFYMLAINDLDVIYRETYILKAVNEMTIGEIANILGENHDTIQKRFEKALTMLKEYLKPYSKEYKE